ncbi:hypothetical protein [Streptomyces brasiliscabiei]|uniref:hypothetical protein n=1 Tax=Streptomyces brasiliscabiei TaxID=2736302 RepID=UPI0027E1DBE2|nr:hypothetical protein [Streptomyces brasiliscabiei]
MIWDARDLARDTVRRQGAGLSAVRVAAKVAEAAARKRETREQMDGAPVDSGPYASDPQEFAELWEARHTEWCRVGTLMEASGWTSYDPAQDDQGTSWARERDTRREGALQRHEAWVRERQDAKDELRAQVWLSADVSRRLRAIAARAGLSAEQVLAQLAGQAQIYDDGRVAVEAFTLSTGEATFR